MTTILVGGDVSPVGRNELLFQKGQAQAILNDLLSEFAQADFSVINLECPLIEQPSPIEKSGSCLGVSTKCVNGLVSIGIDAVNLANNHILDHGEQGLRSTLSACKKVGISCFGAGANLNEAGRVMVREINGLSIGFLGVAEHEFSIAGKNTWGANPIDVIEIVRVLRHTRDEYDFLIVLVHGGKENYPYPTPRLQQICRFMVEEGASAVICQHSHCVGCYEYYQGTPIVYGQGNFIFDALTPKQPHWHEGFLVKLTIQSISSCKAEWIPFSQSWTEPGAKSMSAKQSQELLKDFEQRSKDILEDGVIQERWLRRCKKEKYLHASRIRGHNRLFRILNRKLHFSDWFYSRSTKLIQRNTVLCEVHREALETLWREVDVDF